jgi:hypothetical protein
MAESFIKAFAVDTKKLDAVVGCKDERLLAKLLDGNMVEDVDAVFEDNDCTVEEVLREIMFDDDLEPEDAYFYRRALEVVADVVGRPFEQQATMPGRGWQHIGPIWEDWGQPTLASVWGGQKPYPWPLRKMNVAWPIAFLVTASQTVQMKKELAQFRPGKSIPEGIPRFSEGDWEWDDLAGEMENIAKIVATWCDGDILVWHDGQQ